MANEIDNKKIGNYLSNLIDQYFESGRDFCRKWLEKEGIEITDEEVGKKANRLSQIKNGKKSIQIADLPIFSELLHVTYEQILTGGIQIEKDVCRPTNYTIAQSYDKDKWIEYIDDKRQPILNADEYGKTVLEYALEFENYDFIKFLVEENYIWFDSGDEKSYFRTFGAGTSISQIKFEDMGNGIFIRKPDIDDLQYKLSNEDQLRMYIISLAVDHGDIAMLKELRAREIPELYYTTSVFHSNYDVANHDEVKMVQNIAKSNNEKVIAYFTMPFEITNWINNEQKDTFVFPYLSEMLDLMIADANQYLKKALERAVAHNESTQRKLLDLIAKTQKDGCYCDSNPEKMMIYSSGDYIQFLATRSNPRFVTNIVKVTKEYKGNDWEIEALIERLQNSYNNIMRMPMLKMA